MVRRQAAVERMGCAFVVVVVKLAGAEGVVGEEEEEEEDEDDGDGEEEVIPPKTHTPGVSSAQPSVAGTAGPARSVSLMWPASGETSRKGATVVRKRREDVLGGEAKAREMWMGRAASVFFFWFFW